jgi:predicted transcriptional regulator
LTKRNILNIIEYKELIMGKTITLRVDDNVYNTLKRAAEGDRRTISNFIEYATINYIFSSNVVDDNEMNELVPFEKDIKKGMEDIKKGRYKIIG